MFNNITDFYIFPKPFGIDFDKVRNYILSNGDDSSAVKNDDNVDEKSDVAVIAHRGYSSEAPENTIPALILAAEKGYDTVECDINWTKDSVPILLHDDSINRTARSKLGLRYLFKRKCSDYTYEQLQKFDVGSWKGEEYKGTKIPSFAEALECGNEYNLNMYVELKESGDFDEEKAQILAEAVKEAGMEDKVTWISFNSDYLKMMSELMPESRLGYLSKKEPDEETIKVLECLKNDVNDVFLDVKASKMTDDADELLDESGFDFEAWTVDDPLTLQKMYSYDCQGITTNSFTDENVSNFIDLFEQNESKKSE